MTSYLNFSNGPYGLVQFSPVSSSAATVIAFVRNESASASAYNSVLSKSGTAYGSFTAFTEYLGGIGALFGGADSRNIWTNRMMAGWHMVGIVQTGTRAQIWIDDFKIVDTAISPALPVALADMFVSRTNNQNGDYSIATMDFYPRALSAAEMRQAYRHLSLEVALAGITPGTTSKVMLVDGTSITAGGNPTAIDGLGYPSLYGAANAGTLMVANYATGGATLSTIQARTPYILAAKPPVLGGRKLIRYLDVGPNDLIDGGPYANNVAGYMSGLAADCDQFRQAGFSVVVPELLPNTFPAFAANRTTVNAALPGWVGVHIDHIVPFSGAAELSDPGNTTYFTDGLHLTAAGQAVARDVLATVIDGI